MQNKINEVKRYFARLDLQDITTWPLSAVGGLSVLGGVVFALLGYGLIVKPKIIALTQAEYQESVLRVNFEKKYLHYAKALAQRKQIEQEENTLSRRFEKIPQQMEVSQLLQDISSLGTKWQVNLQAIRLQPQTAKACYLETPIEMSVEGHYHDLAKFLGDLAARPYLITFQNIVLSKNQGEKHMPKLHLNMIMKSYQRAEVPKTETPKNHLGRV